MGARSIPPSPAGRAKVWILRIIHTLLLRDINVKINSAAIKSRIQSLFKTYFDSIKLGDTVNLAELSNNILNIEGVKNILTRRVDIGYEVPRINCVIWNPLYKEDDVFFTSQTISLKLLCMHFSMT